MTPKMAAISAAKPGRMSLPLLGRVRSNALPEDAAYTDDGCEAAPSCLACPLERCRYEEPNGLLTIRMRERNPQIIALRAEGASVDVLMERFGIGRRTVYRVLATQAKAPAAKERS